MLLQILLLQGLRYVYKWFRIQNMRPPAFKLIPWEFFGKSVILSKINKNLFLEKCILESPLVFIPLDHNGQTQVYRLCWGQPDVWLWGNRNFLTEDDDLEKCVLKLEPPRLKQDRKSFFLLDYNRQTLIYRLVVDL